MRRATIERNTSETKIAVEVVLDGTGQYDVKTGVGFFDHMLEQLARHSLIDITVRAEGDLHIDDHHTVEDTGIALGLALVEALGDYKGIRRYGSCLLAMDEALTRAALDLSRRPFLVWKVGFDAEKIGSFDTEEKLDGANAHHIAESAFKAVARALRDAIEIDPRKADAVPSTKGVLGS